MEASIRLGIKVRFRERIYPENYIASLLLMSRVDITLNEECPSCGGRLIEKHEETKVDEGKTTVLVHFRCMKCGKWIKRERL